VNQNMVRTIIFTVLLGMVIVGCGCIGNTQSNTTTDQTSAPFSYLIPAESPAQNQNRIYDTVPPLDGLKNITINATLPPCPATVQYYRGHYGPNGTINFYAKNWSVAKSSLPDESEIPQLAQKALDPYGGIPPDAVQDKIGTSSGKLVNRTTGNVVGVILESRNVNYDRYLNGIPVSGQKIRLGFGENGELLYLDKNWRDLTYIGDVPVISARQAMEKLRQGEVLRHMMVGGGEELLIDNISMMYYATDPPNREDDYFEPIWVFSGPITNEDSETGLSYSVDARPSGSTIRIAANFTASPASGPAPLTVSFRDTSSDSTYIWTWNFGDGTTNTTQNPVHTYTKPGNYTVSVDVMNGNAYSSSLTKPDVIQVFPA